MTKRVTLALACAFLLTLVPNAVASRARLEPEQQEHVLVHQINRLLVPAPAGWQIIRDYQRWLYLERQLAHVRFIIYTPEGAINYVFGRYAYQAHRVASCESGHSIWAENGQYLGMFQMGEYARGRYGHGNTPLAQARAAYAYFAASGYDWSPWSCKP